ncbi:MAG: hypothetical protein V3T19_04665 [Acidiferrobacterales bacterium]
MTKLQYSTEVLPYVDWYLKTTVGLLAWQHPQIIDPTEIKERLGALATHGKSRLGIAISHDLADLGDGMTQVGSDVRPFVESLVKRDDAFILSLTMQTQLLIGHCHEIIKGARELTDAKRGDPVWQFFRHTRNACFHGNTFNITKPRNGWAAWKPALWRGKEIERMMNGSNLFRSSGPDKNFFLQWGDAPILLHDVCALLYDPAKLQPL